MEIIKAWLQGKRNYTYGVIPYNRFGSDEDLKYIFEKGKTEYTEKKLLECLTQLAAGTNRPDRDSYQVPVDLQELQTIGGGHSWPEEKKDLS